MLENNYLKVEINPLGAELFSIQGVKSGVEYLWQGDEKYWKSRSPVLFPIVGALYNSSCKIEGESYSMRQHGVARHLEFAIVEQSKTHVIYSLESSPETKENYPYDFTLYIKYELLESSIVISYQVVNPSQQSIYFQLGAHPGFNFLNFDPQAPVQGYFLLNDAAQNHTLTINQINGSGYLIPEQREMTLEGGKIAITKELFDHDALILEDNQSHDISLLTAQDEEYIRVRYDAPVVGLWSKPCGGYAPFTCIEPWYGRCDRDNYSGEFKDKDWMQHLAPNSSFSTQIRIDIIES
ncbi:MAG: aldose 1-epimerase family protein [Rikenellaceae bacterium]